jgi:hypothetical protein
VDNEVEDVKKEAILAYAGSEAFAAVIMKNAMFRV